MENKAKEYALHVLSDLEEMTDWEEMDEYFDDALDIEYTLNSQRDCIGCSIAMTLGGPCLYVKCRFGYAYVECYWGSDRFESEIFNFSLSEYLENICEMFE